MAAKKKSIDDLHTEDPTGSIDSIHARIDRGPRKTFADASFNLYTISSIKVITSCILLVPSFLSLLFAAHWLSTPDGDEILYRAVFIHAGPMRALWLDETNAM